MYIYIYKFIVWNIGILVILVENVEICFWMRMDESGLKPGIFMYFQEILIEIWLVWGWTWMGLAWQDD